MSPSSDQVQANPPDDRPESWQQGLGAPPLQPLENTGDTRRRALRFAMVVAGVHFFLIGAGLGGAMLAGRSYASMFRGFNMKLSPACDLVLELTRLLDNYWYVLVPVLLFLLLADGAILFALHQSRRTRPWSYLWAFAILLLVLLAFGGIQVVLFQEINKIGMGGLSR